MTMNARALFLSNAAEERVELLWIFMLDLACLGIKNGNGCLRVRIAVAKSNMGARAFFFLSSLALFF
jgi:hypothetical protein